MRGNYELDEVGNNKDELKFRRGGKTILTIYIHEDRFDFLIIFGKAEREKFDALRNDFPVAIQEIYDNSKTYHDGKWMTISVTDLEMLEAIKGLILIKKKPNRKPFPKEQAVYGDCGHRCDLCVHYTGGNMSDVFRKELRERIKRVYGEFDGVENLCAGCKENNSINLCYQKKCAFEKGISRCIDCNEYACENATAGLSGKINAKSISMDDVTWAILPYVPNQYGN